MKQLIIDALMNFRCIGSDCELTCCSGWKIAFDRETAEYYKTVEGPFGDRLRDNIDNINGIDCFKNRDNGDCAFLDENGLCDIYKNLGEDKLSGTCAVYPRDWWQLGDLKYSGLHASCPEAVRKMLIESDSFQFHIVDDDEEFTGDVDWDRYNKLINEYISTVDILQNRELKLSDRLKTIGVVSGDNNRIKEWFLSVNEILEGYLKNTADYHNSIKLAEKSGTLDDILLELIVDDGRFSKIIENYVVYYYSSHFISEYNDEDNSRIVKELKILVSLLCLYLYYGEIENKALMIAKIGREYEHSNSDSLLTKVLEKL